MEGAHRRGAYMRVRAHRVIREGLPNSNLFIIEKGIVIVWRTARSMSEVAATAERRQRCQDYISSAEIRVGLGSTGESAIWEKRSVYRKLSDNDFFGERSVLEAWKRGDSSDIATCVQSHLGMRAPSLSLACLYPPAAIGSYTLFIRVDAGRRASVRATATCSRWTSTTLGVRSGRTASHLTTARMYDSPRPALPHLPCPQPHSP
jgi:hypothetical protein